MSNVFEEYIDEMVKSRDNALEEEANRKADILAKSFFSAIDYDNMEIGDTEYLYLKEGQEFRKVEKTYTGPYTEIMICVAKNITGPTLSYKKSAGLFRVKTLSNVKPGAAVDA